jgi:hypothetical protein
MHQLCVVIYIKVVQAIFYGWVKCRCDCRSGSGAIRSSHCLSNSYLSYSSPAATEKVFSSEEIMLRDRLWTVTPLHDVVIRAKEMFLRLPQWR